MINVQTEIFLLPEYLFFLLRLKFFLLLYMPVVCSLGISILTFLYAFSGCMLLCTVIPLTFSLWSWHFLALTLRLASPCLNSSTKLGCMSPNEADSLEDHSGMAGKAAERLWSAPSSGSSRIGVRRSNHGCRDGHPCFPMPGKEPPGGQPTTGMGKGKRLSQGYGGSLQAENLNWAYKHSTLPSMVFN